MKVRGNNRGNNRSDIDDFIGAEDPFNVQAQKDAQRDIEQTGGTDTRSSFTRQDSFQKSGKFKQPETNPLRKKEGNQNLTQLNSHKGQAKHQ